MKKKILVIGGGASGMMAAIFAARSGGAVTILEHKDRVGKKILSTGNGRCNVTNRRQEPECYRCGRPDFVWPVIQRFPSQKAEAFFEDLGVLLKDRNGYVYPYSDQASTILDVLRAELARLSVEVRLECEISGIRREKDGAFRVETNQGVLKSQAVILAAGSKAAPVTGSDGSGYQLAERLGHRILTPLPALVQLRCVEKHYKQLAGIRTDARVRLLVDGAVAAEDRGELQLTDYGISGIPVFQVSRYAAIALHQKRKVRAVIDFLPQMEEWEAARMLSDRRKRMGDRTWDQWITGLFNKKLGLALLKLAGISPDSLVRDCREEKWKALVRQITAYETGIASVNSYEQAQVCCGGVDTAQVKEQTMESRIVPGLYFAGEILDVDGICGGYNLQWAWSSGYLAGTSAAERKD